MRFAFIGGTRIGYEIITVLLQKRIIPEFAVILKEDEHEAEKFSDEISKLLVQHNINFSVKKKLSGSDYEKFKQSDLDFAIVSGWRTIIDTEAVDYFKFGMIAAHPSLLPKYRGFAPVNWVIIKGEKETGVTLFLIGKGEADSGKIISQKKISIMQDEYAIDLFTKVTKVTIDSYLEFFENYKSGKVEYREQDETEVTYACKRIPDDGRIDWNKSSDEIYNLIRGTAYPYPGAFCFFENKCYHIRKASTGPGNSKKFAGCIPGRVINVFPEGIEVLCSVGTVLIKEWEDKLSKKIFCPSEIVKSIKCTLK